MIFVCVGKAEGVRWWATKGWKLSLHENTEVGEDVTEQAVRLLHLQGNNGEAELREEVKVRTMHVAWSERPRRRRRLRCTFLTSLRLGQVCTCF